MANPSMFILPNRVQYLPVRHLLFSILDFIGAKDERGGGDS